MKGLSQPQILLKTPRPPRSAPGFFPDFARATGTLPAAKFRMVLLADCACRARVTFSLSLSSRLPPD